MKTFKEKDYGNWFGYKDEPPCDWSRKQGATHTLLVLDGSRPAKILKTVAYIGVDEDENGKIVWDKWQIRRPK